MAKSILHVVPHNDEWAVKREGNERASSTHPTQKDAIESAREMAKELDDIVIHRPDGTIRERVTYFGTNDQPAGGETETRTETTRTESTTVRRATSETVAVGAEDVAGVRSRVSWEAVLAGSVVAIAAFVVLSLLALSIGASIGNRVSDRTMAVSAAIVSAVVLMTSLFAGGLVASHLTAGENRMEAAVYGALVWGTVTFGLVAWGLSVGANYLGAMGPVRQPDPVVASDRLKTELGLSEQQAQHYAELVRENQTVRPEDAAKAAWWTFAGVALSLLCAIGGALVGAGPEPVLVRARDARPAVVPAPQPT